MVKYAFCLFSGDLTKEIGNALTHKSVKSITVSQRLNATLNDRFFSDSSFSFFTATGSLHAVSSTEEQARLF